MQGIAKWKKNTAANILFGMLSVSLGLIVLGVANRILNEYDLKITLLVWQYVMMGQGIFQSGIGTIVRSYNFGSADDWSVKDILLPSVIIFGVCIIYLLVYFFLSHKNSNQSIDDVYKIYLVASVLPLSMIGVLWVQSFYISNFNNTLAQGLSFAHRFTYSMVLVIAIYIFKKNVFMIFSVAAISAVAVSTLIAKRHLGFEVVKKLGGTSKITIKGFWEAIIMNMSFIASTSGVVAAAGYYDESHVKTFALAATVAMIMVGVCQAIIQPMAAIFAKTKGLRTAESEFILKRANRIIILGVTIFVLIWWFFAEFIIELWSGKELKQYDIMICRVFVVAQVFRMTTLPTSFWMVARGGGVRQIIPAGAEFFSIIGVLLVYNAHQGGDRVMVAQVISSAILVLTTFIVAKNGKNK